MIATQPPSGEQQDRRRARRPVNMRGYIIREGGIGQPVEMIDLNYGGCGISTSAPLQAGETVSLQVLGRGTIPAQVRWYENGRAGLDFTPGMNASRKQVPRQASRVVINADVTMRVRGRNSFRVTVIDLSPEGCQVDLAERPAIGDRASVKFDGLEALDATVCWVEGHRSGLRFERPIHPAVLDLLLKRLGAA